MIRGENKKQRLFFSKEADDLPPRRCDRMDEEDGNKLHRPTVYESTI